MGKETWITSILWAVAAFDSKGYWEDSCPQFQNIYAAHPLLSHSSFNSLSDSQLLGSSLNGKEYAYDSSAHKYS